MNEREERRSLLRGSILRKKRLALALITQVPTVNQGKHFLSCRHSETVKNCQPVIMEFYSQGGQISRNTRKHPSNFERREKGGGYYDRRLDETLALTIKNSTVLLCFFIFSTYSFFFFPTLVAFSYRKQTELDCLIRLIEIICVLSEYRFNLFIILDYILFSWFSIRFYRDMSPWACFFC